MIQVFVTGGTFDKQYNYITGQLYFEGTHLKEMFERGRCSLDIDVKTLMMVDSLEMTEADRGIIVHNCARAKLDKILITHGTDRMVETAKELAAANIDKTIVLTGAMIPYALVPHRTDSFNLGKCSGLCPGHSSRGLYCDEWPMVSWDKVRKNRSTGLFEAI